MDDSDDLDDSDDHFNFPIKGPPPPPNKSRCPASLNHGSRGPRQPTLRVAAAKMRCGGVCGAVQMVRRRAVRIRLVARVSALTRGADILPAGPRPGRGTVVSVLGRLFRRPSWPRLLRLARPLLPWQSCCHSGVTRTVTATVSHARRSPWRAGTGLKR